MKRVLFPRAQNGLTIPFSAVAILPLLLCYYFSNYRKRLVFQLAVVYFIVKFYRRFYRSYIHFYKHRTRKSMAKPLIQPVIIKKDIFVGGILEQGYCVGHCKNFGKNNGYPQREERSVILRLKGTYIQPKQANYISLHTISIQQPCLSVCHFRSTVFISSPAGFFISSIMISPVGLSAYIQCF